jgi:PAS domain S-box-containing protein
MALDGGGDGYLLSPVEPALLVATVRSLIRQWQKQEDLRSVKATLEQERSRTRFARMAANYGVWDWNVASGQLRWCDELHLVFGTDPSERMTTARWFDLIHEDDREATESAMRRAADGNERFRAEYRIWRNGEGRWLESIGNRMIEAGDAKTQVLSGITIDVTERKRVEEGLRSSEERFRMATRVANEAIWEWNLETDTVSWSDTFAKLLGRTVENGSSPDWWFSHIYPNDRERVSASIYAALNGTASSWECEYRLERPDGTWANIYDRAVIARDHAGKALRIIGAMLDSTELNVTRHRLRVLTGLLPICSACKKIRDAAGSWHVLESYIHDHSEAKFSHGMCPDCAVRWYGAEAGQATAE